MNNEELMHYGVLGMKWGIRKAPATSGGSKRKSTKSKMDEWREKRKASKEASKEAEKLKKRKISEVSNEELKRRVDRLQLENRYREELSKNHAKHESKGKKLVQDILSNSAQNIGTQLTTYMMGTAVNKAFAKTFGDEAIVNPKKGQKDK